MAEAVGRGIALGTGPVPEEGVSGPEVPVVKVPVTKKSPQKDLSFPLPADAVAVFAVPVYGGRAAPLALKRLEVLSGAGTPAVTIAVYGNRAYEKAVKELAGFVERRGFVPVAAGAFVGEHSYSTEKHPIAEGRPDAEDLSRAASFGRAVAAKLSEKGIEKVDPDALPAVRTGWLPMLRFVRFVLGYRRNLKKGKIRPAAVMTDPERCTGCSVCTAVCPAGAITKGDELHTNAELCIKCCACVKSCPEQARRYDSPFGPVLSRNFSRRSEPVALL